MKKIYYFDFLADYRFWLGIIQVAVGVFSGYGCYYLWNSIDMLVLRIPLCLLMAFSSFIAVFAEGIPHITDSIKANYHLVQRVKAEENWNDE